MAKGWRGLFGGRVEEKPPPRNPDQEAISELDEIERYKIDGWDEVRFEAWSSRWNSRLADKGIPLMLTKRSVVDATPIEWPVMDSLAGKHIEAMVHFRKQMGNPDTYVRLGNMYCLIPMADKYQVVGGDVRFNPGQKLKKRFMVADKMYHMAVTLSPSHSIAWNNKGMALHQQGECDRALQCFDKAIELRPNAYDYWINKGDCLQASGRHDDAISSYDVAIKLDQTGRDAWLGKAAALDAIGDIDGAGACRLRVTNPGPDHGL